MNRAQVSLLIPVYNGEAYIGKAIRSALAQSFTDHEIVVLDDGSADASARVARVFGDPRVRVYRRDQHEGIAATRNHLLMAATAPIIAWLDADDVAFPEKLEKQLESLRRRDEIGFVSSSFVEMDAQGQTLSERTVPTDHETLSTRLLHGTPIPMSTVLMRRQAIEAAGGFDVTLGLAADHQLLLRIAEKSKVAATREPLVKCRLHARSVSYVRRHEFREGLADSRRRAVLRRHERPLLFVPAADEITPTSSDTGTTPASLATTAATPPLEALDASAETIAIKEVPVTTGNTVLETPTTPDGAICSGAETVAVAVAAEPALLDNGEVSAVAATSTEVEPQQAEPATPEVSIEQTVTIQCMEASAEAGANPEQIGSVGDAAEAVETPTLVAVVLPATGRDALEAARSVLDQTLQDLQLVVVATAEDSVLERGLELLGDKRVILLHAPNQRRARALNLGVLASRSTYISYLSPEVTYRPNHLERLVETARSERLGLVYSDIGLATKGLAGSAVAGKDFDSELLLNENYIPTESAMHRRDLLHDVGLFNEGLDEGIEWEMWVYLSRAASTRRLPEATADRVVGGERGLRLIPPSPARVRRFLLDRFSGKMHAAPRPALQISRDETAIHGDVVARAHDRFRRGDWAGAASELMEAASRPFNALGQIFSKRYPEREFPLRDIGAEPASAQHLESRPRERVASDVSRFAATSTSAGASWRGTAPPTTPTPLHLSQEPATNASDQFAVAEPSSPQNANKKHGRGSHNWLLTHSGLVGTGRSRGTGNRPASITTTSASALAPTRRPRRKAIGELIQNPPCPLCGQGGAALTHRAGWYRVLDCGTCELAFSHPRLEPHLAQRFFSERRPLVIPPRIRSVEDINGTAYDRNREISWLRQRLPQGRIVDLGCSWGYAAAQARAAGYEVFGTELCKSLARSARERFDLDVEDRDLIALELPDHSLDGALALQVIQHLGDPRALFSELVRVLRPGGVVVGTLPNFDSYLREELGRRWTWMDPESQSFHYRPSAIARELQAVGFEVELWTSEGTLGDATLLELVGEEQLGDLARRGRGSEIGFLAVNAGNATH